MLDMIANEHITAFRVPSHTEAPSAAMIDWLTTCPVDWDGDESGISLASGASQQVILASPGDWVVESQGQWFVLSHTAALSLAAIGG